MADFNVPTQENLNSLYGAWNPTAYFEGSRMQDLSSQFRDQAYMQQQNTTRKGQLDNIFTEQDNPNRVQERVLTNTSKEQANAKGVLEVERAQANHQNNLNADQRAAALKMSEDDIKAFDYHVQDLLRSPDPKAREQGAQLQTYLSSFQLERRKAADAMLLQKEQTRSHLAGIGAQTASQEKRDQMAIDAGKYDPKKFSLSVSNRISAAKNPMEKMEILEDAYATAQAQGDVGAAAEYANRYKAAQLRHAEQEQLKANSKSTLDMNQLTGMPAKAPVVPQAPISTKDGATQRKPLGAY